MDHPRAGFLAAGHEPAVVSRADFLHHLSWCDRREHLLECIQAILGRGIPIGRYRRADHDGMIHLRTITEHTSRTLLAQHLPRAYHFLERPIERAIARTVRANRNAEGPLARSVYHGIEH